jgi:hypothetical protein
LTFEPNKIELTVPAGESAKIDVTVRSLKDVSGTFYAALVDDVGVLSTTTDVDYTSDPHIYVAKIRFSSSLAEGTHSGKLKLNLCRDSMPSVCSQPVEGSPWFIAYTITVEKGTNLTPLTALPGVGPWSGFQGNAAHTGAIPAALDPSKFSRRWGWASNSVSDVAISNGKVFVSGNPDANYVNFYLTAIDEASGAVAWSQRVGGDSSKPRAPAVSGATVYAQAKLDGSDASANFLSLDASTGNILNSVPWSTGYLGKTFAPTIFGGQIYSPVQGYLSEVIRALSENPFAALPQASWSYGTRKYTTPAVDANGLYLNSGTYFYARNPADASSLWSLNDDLADAGLPGGTVGAAVVLDGAGHAYAVNYGPGRLVSVDLASHTWRWRLAGNFLSNPVISGGVLYVINSGAFEARSPDTGAKLWSWNVPDGVTYTDDLHPSIVVAGNIAFVTGSTNTYAVDLNTHLKVWSFPAVGSMALSSNGILYISKDDGLVAINLH